MKTNKFFFLVLVGFLVLPLTAAKDKVITSKWTATPVQIDGQMSEWAPDEMIAEEDLGAKIAVRNDAANIYIALTLENPQFQSSVDQTGVTFWINPAMKSKKVHGIRFYPKAMLTEDLIKMLESQGQALTEERKTEMKKQAQYIIFACDAVDKKGRTVASPAPTAVGTFRTANVQRTKVYEFVLPRVLLDDPENELKVDPAKPFKFGVEWGGMTEEMKKLRAAQMGERSVQASGEGAGDLKEEGGEFGGGGGGSLTSMRYGPKAYSFWVDLQIAPEK